MLQMMSELVAAESSDVALQKAMDEIALETKHLSESFSSHFLMHAVTAPFDGPEQSIYYVQVFIGRYIQSLICDVLHNNGSSQQLFYNSMHITHLLNRLYQGQWHRTGYAELPQTDFVKWQTMLRWWRRLHTDLRDEARGFFHFLRQRGLVHLPQVAHCTCRHNFNTLYRRLVRLCLLLEFINVQHSFAGNHPTKMMRNLLTGAVGDCVQDCVIPALKIKRDIQSGWLIVHEGYGVYAVNVRVYKEQVTRWL